MKEGGGGLRRRPRHDSKSGVSWEGAPARARWFGNGLRSRGHNCRRLGRRPRCRFQNHRCHGQCPRSRGHPARSSRVSRCPRRNPPWKLSRGSETRVHREHSGQLGPPPARGSSRYSRAVRTSWIGGGLVVDVGNVVTALGRGRFLPLFRERIGLLEQGSRKLLGPKVRG